MISVRKAKHLDATTMFTYSHANSPLSQSERLYYLSYFINVFNKKLLSVFALFHYRRYKMEVVYSIFANTYLLCVAFIKCFINFFCDLNLHMVLNFVRLNFATTFIYTSFAILAILALCLVNG